MNTTSKQTPTIEALIAALATMTDEQILDYSERLCNGSGSDLDQATFDRVVYSFACEVKARGLFGNLWRRLAMLTPLGRRALEEMDHGSSLIN